MLSIALVIAAIWASPLILCLAAATLSVCSREFRAWLLEHLIGGQHSPEPEGAPATPVKSSHQWLVNLKRDRIASIRLSATPRLVREAA